MSIGADTVCLQCFLRKQIETADSFGDPERSAAFARDLMALMGKLPMDKSTVCIAPQVTELFTRHFGMDRDRYRKEKERSNAFVMERFTEISRRAEQAEDPVLAGLQMAILGNYLDFSALQGQVSFEKLDEMIAGALQIELDEAVLRRFKQELSVAERLLYITDNAGEIGFDRICARQLQRVYPRLRITFCVRGGPALNDATREDAVAVGVEFPVIDNGTCIPGTELSALSQKAKKAMDSADVILAKGMANVETLYGCDYNIYYAFLIKCQRFVNIFGRPLMTPMLVAEKK